MKARLPNRLVNFWEEHARPHLPDISFITLHYLYFIATGLVSGIIFWGSSTPAKSVSFTDSLFLCVSAMTEAGTWVRIMLAASAKGDRSEHRELV
jgi:hypothetical protein